MTLRLGFAVPLAAALLALAAAARAADPAPPPDEAAVEPVLARPPRLVTFVAATLPPGTAFPAPEVTVDLRIDVSETGAVTAVGVVAGAGAPFAAAAAEAARGFVFEPGVLDTGAAVPVEVTYRYRFTAPPPPPVVFRGLLRERGTRRPLAGVPVAARAGGEVVASATSDAEGRFELTVPAAAFDVVAVPPDHERLEAPVAAVPGEEREETFALERTDEGQAIVVHGARIRREVTKQVIPADVVATAPGTGGDTLRIVQSLPGVARTSFDFGGDLVLRGANPGDSKVFVEGLEVPLAYHFGGLRAVVNARFLDRLEFVPGNVSADYGRLTGGVVDIRLRDPADDLFRGEVDVNLYDAGFALEGPLGAGWAMGGAFHRSYIDAILPAVLPDDAEVSFSTAPRYYDYQLVTTYRPNADHALRLLWLGSNDRVVALFDEPQDDPTIRDAIDMRILFHLVAAQYRARLAPWLRQETIVSFGWFEFRGQFGPDMRFREDDLPGSLRTAWTFDVAAALSLRAGLDWGLGWAEGDVAAIQPPKEGEGLVPFAVLDRHETLFSAVDLDAGFFADATVRPAEGVELVPAVRVDYAKDIDRWWADPRFAARWEVLPGAALSAGVGLYQRPPDGDESNPGFGNPDLLPERSVQLVLGLEQHILDGLDLELAGFYKRLDRLVVRNPDAAWDAAAPTYENDGTGRVLGVELLLRARFPGVFRGWLAYTFQRTVRRDHPGDPSRPMDYDQPHILTALGTFELGRGWTIGARFRFVSGNPETPVTSARYDTSTGTWVPVYGAANSERLAPFHQLDVRGDKTWTFETWKLNLYLEVQNVYNRGNPEGYQYRYDYSDRQPFTGLPILPIFGLRGEW